MTLKQVYDDLHTPANWMAGVIGTTPVTALSIPGTHDSGTEKADLTGMSHCQNFDIRRQLEDGIRFLDIRLSKVAAPVRPDDPLSIFHGLAPCGITFGQVLDWCEEFLYRHPDETILMSVKNENSLGDISDAFATYLNRYFYLYYRSNRLATLDEARGRVVFFFRFPFSIREGEIPGINPARVGISFYDWQDDVTFSFKNNEGQQFQIEDNYKSYDTREKAVLVESALEQAAGDHISDTCYVTFNSIAYAPFQHTPYQYAWGDKGIDPAMNPWLTAYLSQHGQQRYGIILLDYYNNHGDAIDPVRLIIESNTFR